jgi:hypothetical protein
VFAEDEEGLLELVLFDVAVRSEVTTGSASRDEVLAGEQS